jgi:hypothetical protein
MTPEISPAYWLCLVIPAIPTHRRDIPGYPTNSSRGVNAMIETQHELLSAQTSAKLLGVTATPAGTRPGPRAWALSVTVSHGANPGLIGNTMQALTSGNGLLSAVWQNVYRLPRRVLRTDARQRKVLVLNHRNSIDPRQRIEDLPYRSDFRRIDRCSGQT